MTAAQRRAAALPRVAGVLPECGVRTPVTPVGSGARQIGVAQHVGFELELLEAVLHDVADTDDPA